MTLKNIKSYNKRKKERSRGEGLSIELLNICRETKEEREAGRRIVRSVMLSWYNLKFTSWLTVQPN